MEIDERAYGDVTVLTLKGKFTSGEGDQLLNDKLHSLTQRVRMKIVLDLAGVPYIDSTGLQETVRAYTRVWRSGGRLVLSRLTRRIQDLLSITKLLTVIEAYESIDEALASFGAARFEVSCPVCGPGRWANYVPRWFLLSCPDCDARFSPRVDANMLAALERVGADGITNVTAPVSDLWWFTYYENGYGQEGVHLRLGSPAVVKISGRLDLFALDVVELAWNAVPTPRRVLFDTTNVRLASPAGRAGLGELCMIGKGGRAAVLETVADRDRALATLGDVKGGAVAIDVAIRRRD